MTKMELQATLSTHTLQFVNGNNINRSQGSLQERRSLLLRLSVHNMHGFGEACPLPNFAGEDYAECKTQLQTLNVIHCDLSAISHNDITAYISNDFPCAQFALHCALLDLAAQVQSRCIARMLNPNAGTQLQLQSLIDSTAISTQAPGPIIKCKVGSLSIDKERQRLEQFNQQYPHAQIRLDANGAWDIEHALTFSDAVKHLPIAYIEDPCADFDDCLHCSKHSPLPIAIDQYCHQYDYRAAILASPIKHLILKPMALGTLSALQSWISACQAHGKAWVLSDFHNGNLARFHTWHLAQAFDPAAQQVHGLHGHHLFANDYFKLEHDNKLAPHSQSLMKAFHD